MGLLKLDIQRFDYVPTFNFYVNNTLYDSVIPSEERIEYEGQYLYSIYSLSRIPQTPTTDDIFVGWRYTPTDVIYTETELSNFEDTTCNYEFEAVFMRKRLKINNNVVDELKINSNIVQEAKLNGNIVYKKDYL